MGFFSRLFKKKDSFTVKLEPKELMLADLDLWLSEKLNEEPIKQKLELAINQYSIAREELKQATQRVVEAELMNKKISEREKQAVEGNRENYLNQLKLLFSNLIDLSQSPNEVEVLAKNYASNIKRFTESSARSLYILKEYFAHQLIEVASVLKKIDSSVNDIITAVGYDEKKESAKKEISDLTLKIKNFKKILSENTIKKKNLAQKVKQAQALKISISEKISEVKNSSHFTQALKLKQNQELSEGRLKEATENIILAFGVVAKALKRYQRMTAEHEDFVQLYATDPVKAVKKDTLLIINPILIGLKKALEGDLLDFKDRDKLLKKIVILQDQIEMLQKDLFTGIQRLDENKNLVRTNATLQEMDDLKYKLEHSNSQIRDLNARIEKIEEESSSFSLGDLMLEVEKKVETLIKQPIKLKMDDK